MRSHTIAIFLAAYLLFIAAHAGFNGAPVAAQNITPETKPEDKGPVYQLEPVSVTQTACSEDTEAVQLASYEYQLLVLSAVDADALPHETTRAAERNVEAFNARMSSLMEELVDDGLSVSEEAERVYKDGYFIEAYYDKVATSGSIMGGIVSIRFDRSGYTGGAHPNSYASSCLFDLETGQFILDPTQLADDPQAFRDRAAEMLTEKAAAIRENRDAYWQDYAEIISRWNEGTVLFDEEGMLSVYSTYELGPYSMGDVELRLSWEELADLMGPGGLTRLGAGLPETTEPALKTPVIP